jgi:hypothetical protein
MFNFFKSKPTFGSAKELTLPFYCYPAAGEKTTHGAIAWACQKQGVKWVDAVDSSYELVSLAELGGYLAKHAKYCNKLNLHESGNLQSNDCDKASFRLVGYANDCLAIWSTSRSGSAFFRLDCSGSETRENHMAVLVVVKGSGGDELRIVEPSWSKIPTIYTVEQYRKVTGYKNLEVLY